MKIITQLTLLSIFLSTSVFAETTVSTTVTKTDTNAVIPVAPPPATDSSTTTTTTTTQVIDTDAPIVSAVYSQFARSAALIGTNLTVASKDGIVTITGSVTAQAQADEALRLARLVPGVKDVQSNINVTTNPVVYSAPALPNY